jgi:uncharacterized membrane protein YkvA (DUF1232 family)
MPAAPDLAERGGFSHINGGNADVREGRAVVFIKSSAASSGNGENKFRENFWRTARKAARHVPFMEEVVAAYYCALDRETPLRVKGILFAALGYFILPADTIPDVIFGLGFTDDIAVLTAALAAVRAHLKPAHLAAAKEALSQD